MIALLNSERHSPVAAIYALAASYVRGYSARYKAWQKASEIRAELRGYTDRELADIGLNRSQIETMDFSQNA